MPHSGCSAWHGVNLNNATFSTNYKSTDCQILYKLIRQILILHSHNYFREVEKMMSCHAPLRKTRKQELTFKANLGSPLSGLQKSLMIKTS